jgi:hypothetical protein
MADIITAMQAAIDGSNSVNVAPALLGTATFPAGSILRKAKGFNVGQAIYINNVSTDLGVAGAVNLEGVIPNRLTVNVSNTNGSGMLSLGLGPTADSLLTVSFSREAPVVQYHQCIYDAVRNTNGGSCFALNKGEWNISTINGVRFMNFTNQPTTVSTHVRGLTEYKGQVATFRQNKGEAAFSNTASQRLNDVAGDAVRAVLGF